MKKLILISIISLFAVSCSSLKNSEEKKIVMSKEVENSITSYIDTYSLSTGSSRAYNNSNFRYELITKEKTNYFEFEKRLNSSSLNDEEKDTLKTKLNAMYPGNYTKQLEVLNSEISHEK